MHTLYLKVNSGWNCEETSLTSSPWIISQVAHLVTEGASNPTWFTFKIHSLPFFYSALVTFTFTNRERCLILCLKLSIGRSFHFEELEGKWFLQTTWRNKCSYISTCPWYQYNIPIQNCTYLKAFLQHFHREMVYHALPWHKHNCLVILVQIQDEVCQLY